MKDSKKLAIVSKNPIIYHAPLYRKLAACGHKLDVLYLDKMGVDTLVDNEFDISIKWDMPLLDGYPSRFLKNWAWNRYGGFCARINPGLLWALSTKKHSAVLITGYETLSCWLALFVAKLKRLPVLWRGEGTLRSDEPKKNFKSWIKEIIVPTFLKRCDVVLYSCAGNRDYLTHYGVPKEKLVPIPCAVDNDFFQEQRVGLTTARLKNRDELGIADNDFVILFAARLTPRKRPKDLIQAVAKIGEPRIKVMILGDGVGRKELEAEASRLGVWLHITGFQNYSKISKFYSMADMAVCISDYDPSPKALNEALNFELPVVVTKIVGTSSDLVFDGWNGYIIDAGDVDSLAKKISHLFHNRKETAEMGKKSLEKISGFTFEQDVKGIDEALKKVANHG
jgi:glycosyltransferase involved in cell wall biosynthesis